MTFNSPRAMVMIYSHAKVHGQWSVGPEDRMIAAHLILYCIVKVYVYITAKPNLIRYSVILEYFREILIRYKLFCVDWVPIALFLFFLVVFYYF